MNSLRATVSCAAAFLAVMLAGCAAQPSVAQRDLNPDLRDYDRLVVVAVENRPAVARPRAGSTMRGYSSTDSYRVSNSARFALQQIARQYRLNKLAEWPITVLEMQCAVYAIPAGLTRDAVLAQLNADPRVQLAQPLQSFGTLTTAATDPYLGVQQAMDQMGVSQAHRYSLGRGVRVAVIDTGMDVNHPDLAGRVEVERNFVDSDAQRFRQDRHGTAIGGVIAANKDNGVGMTGVAPAAKLLALKACWQLQPETDEARCNSYTLAQALAGAIELRPAIINLSLTGPADPLLGALTARAAAAGIVIVGPGTLAGTVSFPASLPAVLQAVRADTSADGSLRVLRAPGAEVLTLAPGGRYQFASGDSIATAAISGVAALVLARQRHLSAAGLHNLLVDSTASTLVNGQPLRMVNACMAVAAPSDRGSCQSDAQRIASRTGSEP